MDNMDNMGLYNSWRSPPQEALKAISGGRLSGKTDISPMWRIRALTERFGPCGKGWKYSIVDKHTEEGAAGEKAAFVDILLFYRDKDGWSDGIPGTGGASFVAKEKGGLYTSDECYKMALTDAISVACKALGMAADVYWGQDPTKYGRQPTGGGEVLCQGCGKPVKPIKGKDGKVRTAGQVAQYAIDTFGKALCRECQKQHMAPGGQPGKE